MESFLLLNVDSDCMVHCISGSTGQGKEDFPNHGLDLLHAPCCRGNGDPRISLGRERKGETPRTGGGYVPAGLSICSLGSTRCGFLPSVLGGLGFAFLGGGEF